METDQIIKILEEDYKFSMENDNTTSGWVDTNKSIAKYIEILLTKIRAVN